MSWHDLAVDSRLVCRFNGDSNGDGTGDLGDTVGNLTPLVEVGTGTWSYTDNIWGTGKAFDIASTGSSWGLMTGGNADTTTNSPDNPSFNGGDNRETTTVAFCQLDSYSTQQVVWAPRQDNRHYLFVNDNQALFRLDSGNNTQLGSLTNGQTHCLALAADTSGGRGYVDGVGVGAVGGVRDAAINDQNWGIGGFPPGGAVPVQGGLVWDVRYYNDTLSSAEIADIAAGPEPLNVTPGTLSGTAEVGETLTASSGTWNDFNNGTGVSSWTWFRADDASGTNETQIVGAEFPTYTLTASDNGKYIRAFERRSNSGGFHTPAITPTAYTAQVTSGSGGGVDVTATATTATVSLSGDDVTLSVVNPPAVGVQLQLDSDVSLTTSGSDVTAWGDRSANGYDLTGPPGARPTTGSVTTPTGLPAVTFDGVNDLLGRQATDGFTNLPDGDEDRTIFLVARFHDASGDAGFGYGRTGGGGDGQITIGAIASGANEGQYAFQTGTVFSPAGEPLFDDSFGTSGWQILTVRYEDASFERAFWNGTSKALVVSSQDTVVTDTDVAADGFTDSRVSLGKAIDPAGGFAQMDVAAVRVYSGALDDTAREAVETELRTKYLGAAPYNTAEPNITASGRTLTATNGTWTNADTLTVFWQKDGEFVEAALGSSYTVPDGQDGAYRAVVLGQDDGGTGAFAAAISNELTVTNASAAPANTTPPLATRSGRVLSVDTGGWTNSPSSFAYQWQKDGSDIVGATSTSYTVADNDSGDFSCVVTATNASGSADAESNALTVGAFAAPVDDPGVIGAYWDLPRNEDCVGAWLLPDQGSGTSQFDRSGNDNTLIGRFTEDGWQNTPQFDTGPYSNDNFESRNLTSTQSNWALRSTGNLPGGTDARTILFRVFAEQTWYGFDQAESYRYVLGTGDVYAANGRSLHVGFQADNNTTFANTRLVLDFGGHQKQYAGLAINTFYSVAVVVPDGATSTDDVLVYIDGSLATGTLKFGSPQTLNTLAAPLALNYPTSIDPLFVFKTDRFYGRYGEIVALSRALSAAEIAEYHSGPEPLHDDNFPPSITGTPDVGETLALVTGDTLNSFSNGSVNRVHQWVKSNDGFATETPVSGDLTSQVLTYTVQPADAGFEIRVNEGYENNGGRDDFEDRETNDLDIPAVVTACPSPNHIYRLNGDSNDTGAPADGDGGDEGGQDGVWGGTPAYAPRPNSAPGQAADFNGSNIVRLPLSVVDDSPNVLSIAAKIEPDVTTGTTLIFSGQLNNGDNRLYLAVQDGALAVRTGADNWTTGGTITAGNTYDVAVTISPTQTIGYIDGVAVATANNSRTGSLTVLGIGSFQFSDQSLALGFDGRIWDVQVDHETWTPAQVEDLHDGTCPLPTIGGAPTNTLSLVTPVDHQVFQRQTSSNGSILIEASGTAGQAVEARFTLNGATPGAFAGIGTLNGSGSLTGASLAGVPTGRGTLDIRLTNDTGVTDQATNVAVGEVIVCTGQSNSLAEGRHDNSQTYTATSATVSSSIYDESDAWIPVATGYRDPARGATDNSILPRLAPCLEAKLGVPIAFIVNGEGGTTIGQWQSGTSRYSALLATYNAANTNGYAVATIDIGESDAINGTTQAAFTTDLNNLISSWRTDTSDADARWVVAVTGTTPGESTLTQIQAAQAAVIAGDANVFERPVGNRAGLHWGEGQGAGNEAEDEALKDLWCDAIEDALVGDFTLTGDANSDIVLDGADVTLTVSNPDLTLTQFATAPIVLDGEDVGLLITLPDDLTQTGLSATITLDGEDVTVGFVIPDYAATTRTVTLAGDDVSLIVAASLEGSAATITLDAEDVVFVPPSPGLQAIPATYGVTSEDVGLIVSLMPAAAATSTVTLAGDDVTLTVGQPPLRSLTSTVTLAGGDVTLTTSGVLAANTATITLDSPGVMLAVSSADDLTATTAQFLLAGDDVNLTFVNETVVYDSPAVTVTLDAADVDLTVATPLEPLNAPSVTPTLTGQDVQLTIGPTLESPVVYPSMLGHPVELTFSNVNQTVLPIDEATPRITVPNVDLSIDQAGFTPTAADLFLAGNPVELFLTGKPPTVLRGVSWLEDVTHLDPKASAATVN